MSLRQSLLQLQKEAAEKKLVQATITDLSAAVDAIHSNFAPAKFKERLKKFVVSEPHRSPSNDDEPDSLCLTVLVGNEERLIDLDKLLARLPLSLLAEFFKEEPMDISSSFARKVEVLHFLCRNRKDGSIAVEMPMKAVLALADISLLVPQHYFSIYDVVKKDLPWLKVSVLLMECVEMLAEQYHTSMAILESYRQKEGTECLLSLVGCVASMDVSPTSHKLRGQSKEYLITLSQLVLGMFIMVADHSASFGQILLDAADFTCGRVFRALLHFTEVKDQLLPSLAWQCLASILSREDVSILDRLASAEYVTTTLEIVNGMCTKMKPLLSHRHLGGLVLPIASTAMQALALKPMFRVIIGEVLTKALIGILGKTSSSFDSDMRGESADGIISCAKTLMMIHGGAAGVRSPLDHKRVLADVLCCGEETGKALLRNLSVLVARAGRDDPALIKLSDNVDDLQNVADEIAEGLYEKYCSKESKIHSKRKSITVGKPGKKALKL